MIWKLTLCLLIRKKDLVINWIWNLTGWLHWNWNGILKLHGWRGFSYKLTGCELNLDVIMPSWMIHHEILTWMVLGWEWVLNNYIGMYLYFTKKIRLKYVIGFHELGLLVVSPKPMCFMRNYYGIQQLNNSNQKLKSQNCRTHHQCKTNWFMMPQSNFCGSRLLSTSKPVPRTRTSRCPRPRHRCWC